MGFLISPHIKIDLKTIVDLKFKIDLKMICNKKIHRYKTYPQDSLFDVIWKNDHITIFDLKWKIWPQKIDLRLSYEIKNFISISNLTSGFLIWPQKRNNLRLKFKIWPQIEKFTPRPNFLWSVKLYWFYFVIFKTFLLKESASNGNPMILKPLLNMIWS